MTALYGVHDLKLMALPSGVDATELTKWRLRDGTTFDIVYNQLATSVAAQNFLMFNDPLFSGMVELTTDDYVEYTSGATPSMSKRSEYTFPAPVITGSVAHTLPLERYAEQLQWTEDYLANARLPQLTRTLQLVMNAAQDNVEKQILTRFFSPTERQIKGGTGYDMPLANASSTVVYTPPNYQGQSFASSHTHFTRQVDTVSGRALAIDAGVRHLYEHGIKPPYNAIIPVADISLFVGMAETSPAVTFIPPRRDAIEYQNTNTGEGFGDDRFFGYLNTVVGMVMLWATPRLPTDYLGLYKSYGANAMGNPLALRYDDMFGPGLRLRPAAAWAEYPIENAIIKHDFGVGISSGRLNGYAAYFAASGVYTDAPPTIS